MWSPIWSSALETSASLLGALDRQGQLEAPQVRGEARQCGILRRGHDSPIALCPDSCHYLVPISIEIVEEFLGGFGDFGVEGEVLAVDLDGG